MRKIILDANAILRYILCDIKSQADAVEKVLEERNVLVLPEVIAEVIYVLTKYYDTPRDVVALRLMLFFDDAECNSQILSTAVNLYGNSNFDFVDCLLYSYSKNPEYEVFTFDKDLAKIIKEPNP